MRIHFYKQQLTPCVSLSCCAFCENYQWCTVLPANNFRFPPPESICPQGGRKRIGLPRASKLVLQQWLDENASDPYPSKETKDYLSKKANITIQQVHGKGGGEGMRVILRSLTLFFSFVFFSATFYFQVKTWFANARRRLTCIQNRENGYLSWKRCQRREGNKESEKTVHTASSISLENDDKSGEWRVSGKDRKSTGRIVN